MTHYDGALDSIIGLPATRLIEEFPDLVDARDGRRMLSDQCWLSLAVCVTPGSGMPPVSMRPLSGSVTFSDIICGVAVLRLFERLW